ncbi:acyl-CoA carboxylase subunit epsilon [Amnibacterium sp.]|uniref:acyl-CoA carboxylase subunit epsilon n=1 Tax=Amnibacterium sp. TaxID=1872496 RepID=UPI003F7C42F9
MSDGPDGARPIQVLAGSPTDEETAAIAALFSGLLLERSASSDPLPETPVRSAWDRTRRPLRGPWPAEKHWQDR